MQKSNQFSFDVTKRPASGFSWIRILLALLDQDVDPYWIRIRICIIRIHNTDRDLASSPKYVDTNCQKDSRPQALYRQYADLFAEVDTKGVTDLNTEKDSGFFVTK